MSFFLSVFPIVLLIYLMVKRNALPSYVAVQTSLLRSSPYKPRSPLFLVRFYSTVSVKSPVQLTLCVNGWVTLTQIRWHN